jgi:hypothetical protein
MIIDMDMLFAYVYINSYTFTELQCVL